MNSKFYVSLEAARLLKEKGYDRECIAYYHDNCREVDYSFCGERNSTWEGRCVSAPTKAEAIDWLESKEMRINIIYDWIECKWYFIIINGSPTVKNITELEVSDSVFYNTRLEAEEAAIIKALELL
jgi:hypothetical protein